MGSLSLEQATQQILQMDEPAPEQPEGEEQVEGEEELLEQEEVLQEEGVEEEGLEGEEDEDPESEEDEENDEESDGEEGDEEDEDVYEITIADEDGVEQNLNVPASELINGYVRNQDYIKRRKQLTQEYESKQKEAEKLQEQYAKRLEELVEDDVAEYNKLYNTDWERLAQTDPNAYQQYRNRLYDLYGRIQERQYEKQQAMQQRTQKEQEEFQRKIREEQDILMNAIPDWETQREQVKNYLTSQGIQDFSPFVSADLALLAYKAKEFDRLNSKRNEVSKQKVKRKVPKVIKPGTQATAEQNKASRTKKAMGRLKQDHSIDAAVEALLARS